MLSAANAFPIGTSNIARTAIVNIVFLLPIPEEEAFVLDLANSDATT